MPADLALLDMFNDNPLTFIPDLMQDIRAVSEIKEDEYEKTIEYYVLLQSHIAEADKVNLGGMLLIPANIADMTRVLPKPERELWREEQGHIHPVDNANSFSNFVD
jgi:hypothetical protein